MKKDLQAKRLSDNAGARPLNKSTAVQECFHAGFVRSDGPMQFLSVIRRRKNNMVSMKLVLRTNASE